jgi:hypothetical protein
MPIPTHQERGTPQRALAGKRVGPKVLIIASRHDHAESYVTAQPNGCLDRSGGEPSARRIVGRKSGYMSTMTSAWWLVSLLTVPGLFGLAVLMNWLEVFFTHQLVADEVAIAWKSVESADDLERRVSLIVERVIIDSR